MMVMLTNNCSGYVHYLAGRYWEHDTWPHQDHLLGHLYSPGPSGFKGPYEWLPYALDNGVYGAWRKQQPWNGDAFVKHCDKAANKKQRPLWVVVPDSVGNRDETLKLWDEWAPRIKKDFGIPLAFALQDGMVKGDVPEEADVLFIGGTTQWKRKAIQEWSGKHPWIHVGRINTVRWLWYCKHFNVRSCDGTGWFRGDEDRSRMLEQWLEAMAGGYTNPNDFYGNTAIGDQVEQLISKYKPVTSLWEL